MTDTQAAAPTRLDELKPKMELTGTVKKIELFGAFIDVGVGRDGLVHISALSQSVSTTCRMSSKRATRSLCG